MADRTLAQGGGLVQTGLPTGEAECCEPPPTQLPWASARKGETWALGQGRGCREEGRLARYGGAGHRLVSKVSRLLPHPDTHFSSAASRISGGAAGGRGLRGAHAPLPPARPAAPGAALTVLQQVTDHVLAARTDSVVQQRAASLIPVREVAPCSVQLLQLRAGGRAGLGWAAHRFHTSLLPRGGIRGVNRASIPTGAPGYTRDGQVGVGGNSLYRWARWDRTVPCGDPAKHLRGTHVRRPYCPVDTRAPRARGCCLERVPYRSRSSWQLRSAPHLHRRAGVT